MKRWDGRFARGTDARVEEFTASLPFDRRLYDQDIRGSLAHAAMLGRQGIISREEARMLQDGLGQVRLEMAGGVFYGSAADEDIHMYVERRLQELVGPVAGKLHTARSRNDQVAAALHLWVREETEEVLVGILGLQEALLAVAARHPRTVMPGYTHLQPAQPVLLAHHLLAYVDMLHRDWERFFQARERGNRSPLGAGALAGTTFSIDPDWTARELGFAGIYANSMDAVSDRDFVLDFLMASALLLQHLSRLAEELILWSSREFGFVELDDAFSTGSSIMPQKKNPDVCELVRAKAGRVLGNLTGLMTVLKGLPLTYNKDLQEDKEPLFDTADTVRACLGVLPPLLETMQVREEKMREAALRDSVAATDAADHLVRQGVPFRQAHRVVGQIVSYCLRENRELHELSMEEWRRFHAGFRDSIREEVRLESLLAARDSAGGTSPRRVEEARARAGGLLQQHRQSLERLTGSS